MAFNLEELLKSFQEKEDAARAANIARRNEISGIYARIRERAQPGGALEKSTLSQLETAKTQSVASGAQSLVSSGLYGTTKTANLAAAFERDVGAPTRLRLEDLQQQRLSEAELGEAGFLERIQEPYPDYGQFAGMLSQISKGESKRYSSVTSKTTPSLYGRNKAQPRTGPSHLEIRQQHYAAAASRRQAGIASRRA